MGNKRLVQWSSLYSFLINEEEFYRDLLKYKDEKPRIVIKNRRI